MNENDRDRTPATANAEQAELLHKKYQYRSLILRGKTGLPHHAAARLVGPDCAYHLYAQQGSIDRESKDSSE
jgi:hypothetical protein